MANAPMRVVNSGVRCDLGPLARAERQIVKDQRWVTRSPVLTARHRFCPVSASTNHLPPAKFCFGSLLVIFSHFLRPRPFPSSVFIRVHSPRWRWRSGSVVEFQNLVKFGKVLVKFWSPFEPARLWPRHCERGWADSISSSPHRRQAKGGSTLAQARGPPCCPPSKITVALLDTGTRHNKVRAPAASTSAFG